MSPSAARHRVWGVARLVAIYLLVGVLVVVSRPTRASLLAGGLLIVAGAVLRLWAAGHLHKNVELVTAGPYRYTRNPLYLGRLLLFTGLCVMAPLPHGLHWLVLIIGLGIFFGYYLPRKERVEPARLATLHGERFEHYRRSVPALWPTWRPYARASGAGWSWGRARRNREHWMVVALLVLTLVLGWRVA